MSKKVVLYIHEKGGTASECDHYKPLFSEYDVSGLDCQTFTLLETGEEIHSEVNKQQ